MKDSVAQPISPAAIWRSILPTAEELRSARRRLHGKALVIVGLLVASYLVLVVSDSMLLIRFLARRRCW